ncbi:MAG: hypothetical protein JOS17DRAFT_763874, partial [Linnemannia elongata]
MIPTAIIPMSSSTTSTTKTHLTRTRKRQVYLFFPLPVPSHSGNCAIPHILTCIYPSILLSTLSTTPPYSTTLSLLSFATSPTNLQLFVAWTSRFPSFSPLARPPHPFSLSYLFLLLGYIRDPFQLASEVPRWIVVSWETRRETNRGQSNKQKQASSTPNAHFSLVLFQCGYPSCSVHSETKKRKRTAPQCCTLPLRHERTSWRYVHTQTPVSRSVLSESYLTIQTH